MMNNNIYMSKECYDIMNGIEEVLPGDNKPNSVFEKQVGDETTITPEIRAKFEANFGIDQNSRTPAQWKRLVKTYGLDAVTVLEGMTRQEVTNRCTESFGKSLRRSLKKTRN